MEYAKLGNTDIEVSKLCAGCMSFGKAGTLHDRTVDKTGTEKIVKHALDLGINFFDTANGYSEGTSEEYLGRALAEKYGVKMQQIAPAWEWAKGVTSPIIGATKAAHFDDAAGAFASGSHKRTRPFRKSRMCPIGSSARLTAIRKRASSCRM